MQPDSVNGGVEQHRWMIDAIEEFIASVEVDGREIIRVPQWLLPAGAIEGEILRVTHERSGDRSALRVERDASATDAARRASAEQLRRPGTKHDPGGNITL